MYIRGSHPSMYVLSVVVSGSHSWRLQDQHLHEPDTQKSMPQLPLYWEYIPQSGGRPSGTALQTCGLSSTLVSTRIFRETNSKQSGPSPWSLHTCHTHVLPRRHPQSLFCQYTRHQNRIHHVQDAGFECKIRLAYDLPPVLYLL